MSEDMHNSEMCDNQTPNGRANFLNGLLTPDDIIALEMWDKERQYARYKIGNEYQSLPRL